MHDGQPVDPRDHVFAIRLAWRLVGIVQACLREEELPLLADEYYRAIVQDYRDHAVNRGHR